MIPRNTAVLACLAIFGCSPGTKTFSGRITSKTEIPIKTLINVHVSPVQVLVVDGKRFEDLRGYSPFYVAVPKLNSILFVTDTQNHSVVYHIYNMATQRDTAIADSSSLFGHTIGHPSPADSVEVLSVDRIILTVTRTGAKSTLEELKNLYMVKNVYHLDLQTKRVNEESAFYFDKAGNLLMERHYTR